MCLYLLCVLLSDANVFVYLLWYFLIGHLSFPFFLGGGGGGGVEGANGKGRGDTSSCSLPSNRSRGHPVDESFTVIQMFFLHLLSCFLIDHLSFPWGEGGKGRGGGAKGRGDTSSSLPSNNCRGHSVGEIGSGILRKRSKRLRCFDLATCYAHDVFSDFSKHCAEYGWLYSQSELPIFCGFLFVCFF